MSIQDRAYNAVRDHITVPTHVMACAGAIAYDLLHGPSFSLIPREGIEAFTEDHYATFADDLDKTMGKVEETYTGTVADTLRAFIDGLPSELYYDDEWEGIMESAPEGEEDEETGDWIEPSPYFSISSSEIVQALFGRTIAREFR